MLEGHVINPAGRQCPEALSLYTLNERSFKSQGKNKKQRLGKCYEWTLIFGVLQPAGWGSSE